MISDLGFAPTCENVSEKNIKTFPGLDGARIVGEMFWFCLSE